MNSALSIFIIDDDPVFQIVLNAGISLADLPKEVTTFNNGQEALDHLDGQEGISGQVLIFLDINMPVLNGWQFLDALQTKSYRKQILVVMTSASTLVEDKIRALRYPQVIFYQEKPIKLTAVKSLLEEIFENRYVGDDPGRGLSAKSPGLGKIVKFNNRVPVAGSEVCRVVSLK